MKWAAVLALLALPMAAWANGFTNGSDLAAGGSTAGFVGSVFAITGVDQTVHTATIFAGSFVGPVTWPLSSAPGSKDLTYTIGGTFLDQSYADRWVKGTIAQEVDTAVGQPGHMHVDRISLAVAEPGILGLLGTGLVGIAGLLRRKFRTV